jgi:hypothetical protein
MHASLRAALIAAASTPVAAVTALAQGAPPPDTVVALLSSHTPGFFDRLGTVANAVLSLSLFLLAIAALVTVWLSRRTYQRLNALIDRISDQSTPLIQRTTAVASDVREITDSVKRNVLVVEETVATANAEILAAVRQTGARIDQFNALLQVAQDEAESAFVSTAAAVRGVRTGVEQMFDPLPEEDEESEDELDGPTDRRPYPRASRAREAPRARTHWEDDDHDET